MADIIEKTKELLGIDQAKKEPVKIEDDDKVLVKKINLRVDEGEFLLKPKLKEWEDNMKLFDGKHWQLAGVQIPTYKADTIINKFFAAIRSLVAFETDAKPDPEVEARIDPLEQGAEIIREGAKQTRDALSYRWDIKNIPSILTEIYYDRYIFNDGFGMYFWNIEEDDVDFEQLKPKEVLRSPGSTSIDDAEYIIIRKWRTREWFEDNYPAKADKIKFQTYREVVDKEQLEEFSEKSERANLAQVEHYFSDDIWIVKCGDIILEKKKNPFWEWREPEEQMAEMTEKFGENWQIMFPNWKPVKNHLVKPEKPIIQFKGYHLGGEFYSKNLCAQIKPLLFAINKRKCQIMDNADGVGNGQWIIDPSVPDDVARKITSESGLKIKINPALAQKIPGTPLPEFVFQDLQHSQLMFDDMMGHHEVSRGATTSKRQTKTEVLLLKESDITPVRLLMRNNEMAITKLLNGWVQLMKLFYDQPHYIRRDLVDVGSGYVLTRDEIPDNLSIMVKVGSTIPVSKEARRQEFYRLFATNRLDPLSFFKLMEYPNAEKMAYRFVNWATRGILSDEPPLPPQLTAPTQPGGLPQQGVGTQLEGMAQGGGIPSEAPAV